MIYRLAPRELLAVHVWQQCKRVASMVACAAHGCSFGSS
jgi:hypothetical protein